MSGEESSATRPGRIRLQVLGRRLLRRFIPADSDQQPAASLIEGRELERRRDNHPLSQYLPIVLDLLLGDARDVGHGMFLTEDDGTVLWLEGTPSWREGVESAGLVIGSRPVDWIAEHTTTPLDPSESLTGKLPAGPLSEGWGFGAIPVFDPRQGSVVGMLGVAGAEVTEDKLLLLRAVSRLLQEAMSTGKPVLPCVGSKAPENPQPAFGEADAPPPPARSRDTIRLKLLGPGPPTAGVGGVVHTLSPRRADVLYLLSQYPDGLTADELAQELYGDRGKPVTVRAEMYRIRRMFVGLIGASPYRFLASVKTDADVVYRLLAGGCVLEAVLRYTGSLLPHSDSLGVAIRRAELHQAVRNSALQAGGEALVAWCGKSVCELDAESIERLIETLDRSDPMRPVLQARLERVESLVGSQDGCNPIATPKRGHFRHG